MSQNIIIFTVIGVIILVGALFNLIKAVMGSKPTRTGDDLFITEDDIYEQVKITIGNGNHVVAQKLARKYLKENPSHDRLRVLLARSYYDTNSLHDAIEHFEILIKTFPDRNDLFLMLADAYTRTGKNSSAIDTYLALLEINPDDANVLLSLAELYNSVNHKKSALNTYKRLLNQDLKDKEKVDYYVRVANIYKDLGEYENAVEYAGFALNTDHGNINILYLLKDLYSLMNNMEKEIEVMNRLLVLAPNDAYLQADLVKLYYASKQYDLALDIAVPALNTPNADVESLQNIIANIYIKTDKIVEGIKILEDIINTFPGSIRLIETLAYAYRLTNKYDKAMELYETLIDMADIKTAKIYNQELSSVYCDWALQLYNEGKTKDTFQKFEEALRLNPENPDIYHGLGRVNFLAKNYNDAIRQMQRAIDLDTGNANLYLFLGDIYAEIDNIYEAERIYKEAVYIDGNNAECRAKLGIMKLKQKDISEAKTHLESAVKADPQNCDYIYNLALVYELSGDINKAKEAYNGVLKINPEHKDAINNLKIIDTQNN